MRVLFLTRKHPPSVGGMEKLSYELVNRIGDIAEARVIAWGGGQHWLLLFIVYSFLRGLVEMGTRRPDVLHLGDPVMCLVGVPLGRLFRVPTVVTVHGLDITYPRAWYQRLVVPLVSKCVCVVCISDSTYRECKQRGVQRAVIIPPGIDPDGLPVASATAKQSLRAILQTYGEDRLLLLTVGRLVRRKGVARFVRDVLPGIVTREPRALYLVVGDGPGRAEIERVVADSAMAGHVHIFGRVESSMLAAVYEAAMVFVMPNQPVSGDMEGFGLVAVEANLFRLPVVASELEGITDAVAPGENGYLVKWDDPDAFVTKISALLGHSEELSRAGRRAHQYVLANFSWDAIARRYIAEFEDVISSAESEKRQVRHTSHKGDARYGN